MSSPLTTTTVVDPGLQNPVEAASLVNYQPGAVVSRTLIKSKPGTVTVFAFDEKQELSEHTAPFDALVQVLDGQGEFIIAGQSHQVSAGQMLNLPANQPHAVRAVSRFKMILTMIRFEDRGEGQGARGENKK